jgi:hypothetical protein
MDELKQQLIDYIEEHSDGLVANKTKGASLWTS